MYEILHSIDVTDLQTRVNQKLIEGFIPIGTIAIRNIGKPFKETLGDNITEIEYYQPMWKPINNKHTQINIFNKSCILKFE